MLNKKYKEVFDNVRVDQKIKDEKLNYILNRHRKAIIFSKPLFIAYTLLILFLGCGIVIAVDKSNLFNGLKVEYKEDDKGNIKTYLSGDVRAEVNYTADIPEIKWASTNANIYSNYELYKLLGIKFLTSDLFIDNNLKQLVTEKVENNISNATFIKEDCVASNKYKLIWFRVSFKTKYYTNNVVDNNDLAYSDDSYEFYINNLNTMSIVSKMGNTYAVAFVYDDVYYNLTISFLHDTLEEEYDSLTSDILNSLHY